MTNEPSSPPCSSAGADDSYTVYASRDELVAALDELLEAERAGARVALASSKAMQSRAKTDLEGRLAMVLSHRNPNRKAGLQVRPWRIDQE